ncbi:MAG: hypothetical protein N0E59_12070 [Candidatus Thiodiazotropha taylori]|nr:hypothetical protein [Candidatus Thiodiazotropha taylori]MCG8107498.1 hypothetical protein [Candidatus Thiodiazotropha taylori]MCG8111488.1 hypothetical protein [Candidatus Thiodiazotropha taylori]MCW4279835.1 hypothetical protein [Candidatus Thiodiazotropha taylori]MCW4283842.1 hypothetical protein [Candidatus Thiodiazotropha taylori]
MALQLFGYGVDLGGGWAVWFQVMNRQAIHSGAGVDLTIAQTRRLLPITAIMVNAVPRLAWRPGGDKKPPICYFLPKKHDLLGVKSMTSEQTGLTSEEARFLATGGGIVAAEIRWHQAAKAWEIYLTTAKGGRLALVKTNGGGKRTWRDVTRAAGYVKAKLDLEGCSVKMDGWTPSFPRSN